MVEAFTTKFASIQIDEFVIMPNHFHGIINIIDSVIVVGADPCVRPVSDQPTKGTHAGVPLHQIIQWFKTMTTNDYSKYVKQNDLKTKNKLWQRNFYEHVIRNEKELNKAREYIANNPAKWPEDRNNPLNIL